LNVLTSSDDAREISFASLSELKGLKKVTKFEVTSTSGFATYSRKHFERASVKNMQKIV